MTTFLLGIILGLSAAVLLCKIADRRRDLEKRELHVCPFCGSFICVEIVRADVPPALSAYGLERWRCACHNCGALGPEADSEALALRYWGGGWP